MTKISLIGFGNIGFQVANYFYGKVDEIAIFDINKERSQGKILDITHSQFNNSKIYLSEDYQDLQGSDVVIITAGLPRKQGQTREELMKVNATIISSIAKEVGKYASNSIVVNVTNPLDKINYLFYRESGMDRSRIIGMSCLLDTQRFKTILGLKLKINPQSINAMIIGEHNEKMFLVKECLTINSLGYEELIKKNIISSDLIESSVNETIKMGATINELTGSSAFLAPAKWVCYMAELAMSESTSFCIGSVIPNGEYGIKDLSIGLPFLLSKKGITEIIQLDCLSVRHRWH